MKKYLGAKLKGFFRKDEACEHYLLNWARQIYDRKDILGLQDLIKLVMRPLQSRHMVDAYLKMPHRAMEELWWLNSLGFIGRMPGRDMEINYFIMQSAVSVPPDLVLDLSSDTVLPTPWHPSSIVNMIGRIGPGRPLGKFKQSTNHRVTFMSPINLGWVDGGNHSITQAIISGEGQLVPNVYLDVTEVVKRIYFDGKAWRCIGSGEKRGQPRYVELGLVWEISRLIVNLKESSNDSGADDRDCVS
ncbi:DUF6710 family protein [Pseudomonas oryzihabitans]|uniref:DUF6710 family protein n=1 Tax=Pseudomonas oryzihabitans TaxID=47885 RepID=UPI0028669865|nr:DUF6710 family protein [Pseudomonas psychrotolerans]MDR6680244.1 hypothetical protein [Pseudomonas psychrotolerans]